MNPYLAGAVGGTLGTIPMTAVMEVLFRRLPSNLRYPLPPREVTMAVAHRAGLSGQMSEQAPAGTSLAAHFGYGLLTGSLYPLTIRRRPRHPLLHGSLYGLIVWTLSYFVWIPAFRLLTNPLRHPPPRRRLMIAAHLVWGAALALVTFRLVEAEPSPLLRGFHDRRRRETARPLPG